MLSSAHQAPTEENQWSCVLGLNCPRGKGTLHVKMCQLRPSPIRTQQGKEDAQGKGKEKRGERQTSALTHLHSAGAVLRFPV